MQAYLLSSIFLTKCKITTRSLFGTAAFFWSQKPSPTHSWHRCKTGHIAHRHYRTKNSGQTEEWGGYASMYVTVKCRPGFLPGSLSLSCLLLFTYHLMTTLALLLTIYMTLSEVTRACIHRLFTSLQGVLSHRFKNDTPEIPPEHYVHYYGSKHIGQAAYLSATATGPNHYHTWTSLTTCTYSQSLHIRPLRECFPTTRTTYETLSLGASLQL